MADSVAVAEVSGKVGVKMALGAANVCWFVEVVGNIDTVDGSTAGRGRNRWAKLEIDIISTASFDYVTILNS